MLITQADSLRTDPLTMSALLGRVNLKFCRAYFMQSPSIHPAPISTYCVPGPELATRHTKIRYNSILKELTIQRQRSWGVGEDNGNSRWNLLKTETVPGTHIISFNSHNLIKCIVLQVMTSRPQTHLVSCMSLGRPKDILVPRVRVWDFLLEEPRGVPARDDGDQRK